MARSTKNQTLLTAQLSGLLFAAWPLVGALGVELWGVRQASALRWPLALTGLASLGFVLAATALRRRPSLALGLAIMATLSTAVLAAPRLGQRPTTVLLLACLAGALIVGLRVAGSPARAQGPLPPEARGLRLQVAALVGSLTWFGVVLGHMGSPEVARLTVAATTAVTLLLSLDWLRRGVTRPLQRRVLPAVQLIALALCGAFAWLGLDPLIPLGAALLAPLILTGWAAAGSGSGLLWWSALLDSPARILVSTFALLSVLGAFLLAMPSSAATATPWGMLDAAFTSVSAVCVTGLIVRSTPQDLSASGQAIVLGLIQLGGLGIMTLSTAALAGLGRRLSLRHEFAMAELLSGEDQEQLFRVLGRLLKVTLACELAGALALWPLFMRAGDGAARGLWRACFTAISAFCNAGFALQDDSLMSYRQQPLMLHLVATLIVLGGLSPVVVTALPGLIRRRRTRAQIKIVVVVTVVLLLGGTALFAGLEWRHALAGLSAWDKLHNAWFQSVTARTAGFNSVAMGALYPATRSLLEGLMFVGGSPGSTAGGIKTTTLALIVLSVLATLRSRDQVRVFGRHIAQRAVNKSWAIATISLAMVGLAFFVMQLTQRVDPGAALFEVVSALGTVGLSQDLTSQLDPVGKILIMLCMFAGRVGPLSLFLLLADRRQAPLFTLPREDVEVG